MGTVGLCEIVYMRLVYIEQVWSVERKKEYRTGDLFLISATTVPAKSNSWKEIFVWVHNLGSAHPEREVLVGQNCSLHGS